MLNETTIINFGFPDLLNDLSLQFCFDDELAEQKLVGTGCHCEKNSVKFFLYDSLDNQCIFTMDFYVRNNSNGRAFDDNNITNHHIYLQHIATSSLYRKHGIASFYLKKLVEYCEDNDIHIIAMNVAPSTKNRENALEKDELTKFYKGFSTDKVQIEII